MKYVAFIAALLLPCAAFAAVNFPVAGTGYLMTRPAPKVNSLTTPLSLTAWIYPRTEGGSTLGRIYENISGSTGWGFQVCGSGGSCTAQLQFNSAANGGGVNSSINAYVPNRWTFVAISLSGTTVSFYSNGVPWGTATLVAPTAVNAAINGFIGNRGAANRGFDGFISDLRIYNRALSRNEIRGIMRGTPVSSGLVLWQKLFGVGNVEPDWSGNKYYATSTLLGVDRNAHRGPPVVTW